MAATANWPAHVSAIQYV